MQSARSGSLLLTAANLAQIHQQDSNDINVISTRNQNIQYYLDQQTNKNDLLALPLANNIKVVNEHEDDNVSVASSMHFTVVNVNTRPQVAKRSFCRKHQLTILVLTMSALFTIGILTAILLLESKYKEFSFTYIHFKLLHNIFSFFYVQFFSASQETKD